MQEKREKSEKNARALFFLYFGPPQRGPTEITFALPCKLQPFLPKKNTLVQAQTIFFCRKVCKFKKFVVILHAFYAHMA